MLLSFLVSSLLWTIVMSAIPPPAKEALNIPQRCVSDPAYRQLKKGRPNERVITDPVFLRNAASITDGQLSEHLMNQKLSKDEKEALFDELRAFWEGYHMMQTHPSSHSWSVRSRRHCIKGYQEGMIFAKKLSREEAGDWGGGYRAATIGWIMDSERRKVTPKGIVAGYDAAVEILSKYPGGEDIRNAYGDCFGTAVEDKEWFTTDRHAESVSRGYLNGLTIGSCQKGFQSRWQQQFRDEHTLQQDGEWFIKCLESARRQCRRTPEEKAARMDPGTKLIREAERWAQSVDATSRDAGVATRAAARFAGQAGQALVKDVGKFDFRSVLVRPPSVGGGAGGALKPGPVLRPVTR